MRGGTDLQVGVLGEDERADIKGFAAPGRDPLVVDADDLLDRRLEDAVRERRNAETTAGFAQARRIAVGAEYPDLAVRSPERLQSLENGLPVVQGETPRMHGDRRERNDLRLSPRPVAVAQAEHVIGEVIAESEPGRIDLRTAARRGAMDPEVFEHAGHFGLRWMGRANIHDGRPAAAPRTSRRSGPMAPRPWPPACGPRAAARAGRPPPPTVGGSRSRRGPARARGGPRW